MKRDLSLIIFIITLLYSGVNAQMINPKKDGIMKNTLNVTNNADLSNWTINVSEMYTSEKTGMEDNSPEIGISGNTVHTVWWSAGDNRTVFYRRSTDGGKSWEARKIIYSGKWDYFNSYDSKRLAVDGDNIHIICSIDFYEGSDRYEKLVYIRSTDGGNTFERPDTTLFITAWAYSISHIFVSAENGRVAIGLTSNQGYNPFFANMPGYSRFYVFFSEDAGKTFAQTRLYHVNNHDDYKGNDFKMVGDNIYVIYNHYGFSNGMDSREIYFTVSTDKGRTFSDPQKLTVPNKSGEDISRSMFYDYYVPKMAIDGNNVFVVFEGYDNNNQLNVFVRKSTDNGRTFQNAVNLTVNDTELPSERSFGDGRFTIAAKGSNVYVAFATNKYNVWRLYLKRSNDGGVNFEKMQEFTGPNAENYSGYTSGGSFPVLMIDPAEASGNKFHLFWDGGRYLFSTNGGASLSGAYLLMPVFSWKTNGGYRPQTVIGTDGSIHAVATGNITWYSTGVFGDVDIFYRRFDPVPADPSTDNMALYLASKDNAGDGTGDERFDNMNVKASSSINFTSAMTISAWIKPERKAGESCYFIYKKDPGAGGSWGSYLLGQWTDGTLDGRIATTEGGYVLVAGSSIPNDIWTHVAMTYDANGGENNLRIYVDGKLAGKLTAKGNIKSDRAPLYINAGNYYEYKAITIDELSLWSIALSESEIASLMNKGLNGTETGLSAYYNFNNTTKDLTGNGNHGVLMYKESFVAGKEIETPYVTCSKMAEYSFDGNVNDASGNNKHGVLLGGASVSSNVLSLGNNATDGVSIPNTILNNITDFTFFGKLKINTMHSSSNSDGNMWLSMATAAQPNAFLLGYFDYAKKWYTCYNNQYYFFDVNSAITDKQWHYIAVTRKGTTAKLYVDGNEIGTGMTVPADALKGDPGGLIIGQDQGNVGGGFETNQCWAGEIDDMKIYNCAKTASEIKELSEGTTPITCKQIAYYPFNGNANDESGNSNNGTLLGSASVSSNVLTVGDNNKDALSLPTSIVNNMTDFTFFSKLKLNFIHTTAQTTSEPKNVWFSISNSTSSLTTAIGYYSFRQKWYIALDGVGYLFGDNTVIEDKNWHSVAVTRQGNVGKLYIDGTQVGSSITVSTYTIQADPNCFIVGQYQDKVGSFTYSFYSWAGEIDNMKVFGCALSSSEIRDLAGGTPNSVTNNKTTTPSDYVLYQNYPNPFNPSTTIDFFIPKQGEVSLKVYDILGKEVSVLVNEKLSAGFHKVYFDAGGLTNGLYIYRLQTDNFIDTKKLILLK